MTPDEIAAAGYVLFVGAVVLLAMVGLAWWLERGQQL